MSKWIAVLAPNHYSAEQDWARAVAIAQDNGLLERASKSHILLDFKDGTRFQWTWPGREAAVEGARFDEWSPVAGYSPGPEAWRLVKLLQVSVEATRRVNR